MVNSVRYELEEALRQINEDGRQIHTLVTAVLLPTGAKEIAINSDSLIGKLTYILGAYDTEMRLKTNTSIVMTAVMVVW